MKKLGVILVAIVVLLLALGGGGYFYAQKKATDEAKAFLDEVQPAVTNLLQSLNPSENISENIDVGFKYKIDSVDLFDGVLLRDVQFIMKETEQKSRESITLTMEEVNIDVGVGSVDVKYMTNVKFRVESYSETDLIVDVERITFVLSGLDSFEAKEEIEGNIEEILKKIKFDKLEIKGFAGNLPEEEVVGVKFGLLAVSKYADGEFQNVKIASSESRLEDDMPLIKFDHFSVDKFGDITKIISDDERKKFGEFSRGFGIGSVQVKNLYVQKPQREMQANEPPVSIGEWTLDIKREDSKIKGLKIKVSDVDVPKATVIEVADSQTKEIINEIIKSETILASGNVGLSLNEESELTTDVGLLFQKLIGLKFEAKFGDAPDEINFAKIVDEDTEYGEALKNLTYISSSITLQEDGLMKAALQTLEKQTGMTEEIAIEEFKNNLSNFPMESFKQDQKGKIIEAVSKFIRNKSEISVTVAKAADAKFTMEELVGMAMMDALEGKLEVEITAK